MKSGSTLLITLCVASLLSGCVVRTAASIVTAPVRVAGKAVDWTTTSQSEADEKRGREMREREEALGKLDRQYKKHVRECENGRDSSCDKARDNYDQIQALNAAR